MIFQPSPEVAYDLLVAADMLLLPCLKRQCGNLLARQLEEEDGDDGGDPGDRVVALVRTARLFDLPRLEHLCVEHMAENIVKVGCCNDLMIGRV